MVAESHYINLTKHNIEHQGCTHLYSVLTVNHLALQRSTFSTNSLFSACISHGQNPWPCVLEVKVLILELFSINGFAPSTIASVFWMQTYGLEFAGLLQLRHLS